MSLQWFAAIGDDNLVASGLCCCMTKKKRDGEEINRLGFRSAVDTINRLGIQGWLRLGFRWHWL